MAGLFRMAGRFLFRERGTHPGRFGEVISRPAGGKARLPCRLSLQAPSIEQTTEQPEQFPVQRTWEIILTNPSMVAANNEDSESDGRNYNALSLLRAEVAKAKAIPAIARRRAAR
jgi:hypothetical protein